MIDTTILHFGQIKEIEKIAKSTIFGWQLLILKLWDTVSVSKGLLTDKSDAIGSCNLKPNDNDNENDDNLSSN